MNNAIGDAIIKSAYAFGLNDDAVGTSGIGDISNKANCMLL